MLKSLMIVAAVLALVAAGYVLGFERSIAVHGDWLLLRTTQGRCEAYDPETQRVIGVWGHRKEKICRMRQFIQSRVFAL